MKPWHIEPKGRFERSTVTSQVLLGNPLGDPHERPLWVYLPPGVGEDPSRRYPSIYLIQGFTGQVDMWWNRSALRPSLPELMDELFAGGAPPAVVVLVDCWTSLGGSQFLNSPGTGRYLDYLCDEVVAFVDERYPTLASRDHRGITGKSSGGYGAMVVPMLRPDVFGALASHAGDALFEACYLPEFRDIARKLRDEFEGSYDVFFERLAASDRVDWDTYGVPLMTYGCAAAYSPDPDQPGKAILPFDIATSRLREDVWQEWLEKDPVRMAPSHADALRSMRRIYLDGGRADEYFLDLGAEAFAAELRALDVDYTLELFDGKHGGLTYRYPGAIRELVLALTP